MNNILGSRLKELRLKKDKLQKDVASYLNISDVAYGYYEKGERQPNPEMLLKLAEYFGVTTDYLLGRTENDKLEDEKIMIAARSDVDLSDLTEDEQKYILDFIKMFRKNKNSNQ